MAYYLSYHWAKNNLMINVSHVYKNCSYKSVQSGDITSLRIYITIGEGEVIHFNAAFSFAYELEFIE